MNTQGPAPLQHSSYTETKKYGPNERTDQNSRKRAKQQGDSQPIRCRVQNTGISMLTEVVEYGPKIEEEVKAM